MRKFYFASLLLILPLLACSIFSNFFLQSKPISTITSTPVNLSPPIDLILTNTPLVVPDETTAVTVQAPSAISPVTASISATLTASPTTTPFPTIIPMACLDPLSTPEYGQVQRVVDGSSILVDIKGRLSVVHYLGIQSPENLPFIQYLGPPAATQNAAFVQGQIVRLIPDRAFKNLDGPLYRYVSIYNTQTFVNFELLRLGLAKVAADSSELACYDTFELGQQQARLSEVGLWAPTPTLLPSATPRPTRTSTYTQSIPTTGVATASATPSASVTGTPPTASASPTPGTPTNTPTAGTITVTFTPGTPTASSTLTPTPGASSTTSTLSPTPGTPTATPGGLIIVSIFPGTAPTTRSDGYIEIKNTGPTAVNLSNWWIFAENELAYFTFGQVTLNSGQTCRIYSNQSTGTAWCGSFESPTPIWSVTSDCGELNNPQDELIERYCYP
jgi:endonuclease YncB( thermonuclease family)